MNQELLLSREQVRRVDQRAIEAYGVPGIVLMENAGRGAAEIIRQTCPSAHGAIIACGPGNNGGDGFVIARHLANAGWMVELLLACPADRLTGDAQVNFRITQRMNLPGTVISRASDADAARQRFTPTGVIVDALLGTGASGPPREPIASLIRAINSLRTADATQPPHTVFAVDIPSGLDCDTGDAADPTVRADHTITFVAQKIGFRNPAARDWLGQVHVVDIGAPRAAIQDALTGKSG
ncbi:MAG: NAD(P)H-hydrate epimerase [Phycisphaerae bacterium]|nr:MAG: NAD(P)H-hydrate epimerase [Planctomycetia bacterium]RIK70562.1 MAG: NAD(P)H-hydrate epimerase [Planctomycetota bacterium]GJQ26240.1 MAG: NAD(P)H-hydrate epimerase [Phycisphaerae bacterium]